MKIQEGLTYRTRSGKIRGPMMEHCASNGELLGFKDALSSKTGFDWYPNGKATFFDEDPLDLVKEVTASTAWKDLDNAEKGEISLDLVEEVTVATAWKDLDDAEKGEILLAVYRGDPVEYYENGEWHVLKARDGDIYSPPESVRWRLGQVPADRERKGAGPA